MDIVWLLCGYFVAIVWLGSGKVAKDKTNNDKSTIRIAEEKK